MLETVCRRSMFGGSWYLFASRFHTFIRVYGIELRVNLNILLSFIIVSIVIIIITPSFTLALRGSAKAPLPCNEGINMFHLVIQSTGNRCYLTMHFYHICFSLPWKLSLCIVVCSLSSVAATWRLCSCFDSAPLYIICPIYLTLLYF